MKKFTRFILIELAIFVVMSLITILELVNTSLFESLFNIIKSPSSWFMGVGLAYTISSLTQEGLFSLFSKKRREEGKEKGDFFVGFVITLMITSIITPYVYQVTASFLENFLIYFHVILLQSVILIYLLFKVRGGYTISSKYFLTTELIILVHTAIILAYVA